MTPSTTAKQQSPSRLPSWLLAVVLLLAVLPAAAQSVTMPASGAITDTLSPGTEATILDPGGNGNYPANCASTLTLVAARQTAITLSGSYRTEAGCDIIKFYDGPSTANALISTHSGVGNVDITAISGSLTILFESDQNISMAGFSFTVTVCDTAPGQPFNVAVDSVSHNSASLSWSDAPGVNSWTLLYGTDAFGLDHTLTTSAAHCVVGGLAQRTRYYYRVFNSLGDTGDICSVPIRSFLTSCPDPPTQCIDYDDLTSCYVSATYGTYANPYANSGIVDYGASSQASRHTVHSDTSERDSRTDGMLRTIPPGFSSSVRLGNWSTGGQAESIAYEYTVDTSRSNLLIMKYAAVLQDPNHGIADQPRFAFQILDADGVEVNPSCYSANFIASSGLGWHTVEPPGSHSHWSQSTVLWKDWTTVGIDLDGLHGETITLRLTTYDCGHQQHYGYAYFVFDCSNKTLTSTSCGDSVENTFTAPDGFSYRWYNADSAAVTLDTTQSLHVTQAGLYRCAMSFVGAPAGASCTFELDALAGSRYPAASFTADSLTRIGCDLPVTFTNTSRVSTDASHQHMTAIPCEHCHWIVDGDSIAESSSVTATLAPGTHTVALVATLGTGLCADTATLTLQVYNPCLVFDTVAAAICQGDSLLFFDTIVSHAGVYERDSGYTHRTLILSVNRVDSLQTSLSVIENSLPFTWNNDTVRRTSLDAQADTSLFTLHYATLNSLGCDSAVTLSLMVLHNKRTYVDSSLCENDLPLLWNGVAFAAGGTGTDTLATAAGTDSVVIMTVAVLANSHTDISDTAVENQLPLSWHSLLVTADSLDRDAEASAFASSFLTANHNGCDSLAAYSLLVWHNVSSTTDSVVCENALPLAWNGVTLSTDTTLTVNLAAAGRHGQDSAATLTLRVLHNSSLVIDDTIVENALPYLWNGIVFSSDSLADGGTSTHFARQLLLANAAGCDSTVHFSLLVWHNYSITLSQTICDDALPYLWCDTLFLEGGSKTLHYTSLHGSDSTVSLILVVNSTYTVADTAAICDGQTDAHGLGEQGDYALHFSTVDGCDSLLLLSLVVHPVYDRHFADTICDNQRVFFDGNTLTDSGTYTFAHISSHGCDSLLTLDLTVFATHHSYDRATVCDGVPFTWIDGNTYAGSTYDPSVTLSDIHGCDSTIHLILDIDHAFEAAMEITPQTVTATHPDVRLRDISRSGSRVWYVGDDSDTCRIYNFQFPAFSDSLAVLLVARSTTGCIDSAWGMVRCDRSSVWPPNAFTPDEQQNTRFFIPSNDIASGEVWVYSRQGLLVAHFDAISGSWDGTSRGRPCPQDAYTWIMTYTTKQQPRVTQQAKGTVTLLR